MPARRIFRAPRSSRRCRPPTTSRASPPKTRWRACPTPQDIAGPDEQPDLDLFHPWNITSEEAAQLALACEARRLRHRQAHHQQRRRRRVGAAKPFLQRPHARLSRRLRQLAPFDLGGADRRQGRRHAARRLVQLDAQRRRTGRARGRRPLCRRTRAGAPEVAQDRHPRMPGAVRVAAGGGPAGRLRAGRERRRALSQEHLPARFAGQEGLRRPHRRGGRPAGAARQGQRRLRRGRRAHQGAQGGGRRAGRGLFPQQLFGAQAGHEDHRQCRRLAQPDAHFTPDAAAATTCARCCASWAPACS